MRWFANCIFVMISVIEIMLFITFIRLKCGKFTERTHLLMLYEESNELKNKELTFKIIFQAIGNANGIGKTWHLLS